MVMQKNRSNITNHLPYHGIFNVVYDVSANY